MLKPFGGFSGFKSNAKLPPVLVPVVPCQDRTHELCNGWFVPCMFGQKNCLHCLNYQVKNPFPSKVSRDVIITDITVTWQSEKEWCFVAKMLLKNKQDYEDYLSR